MASAGERPGPLEGKHVHRSRLLAATALTVTTLAASALVAVAQPATAAPAQTFAIEAGPLNAALIAYVSAVVDCYLALSAGRAVRTASECRSPAGAR